MWVTVTYILISTMGTVAKNLTTVTPIIFLFLATHHNLRMRSFNQPKRRRRQRERAVNDFERAFSEVDLATPSRIQAACAAAAIELGGECNPTSGTEGLSEICAAVAAPRRDSATAAAASRDSALNLGDGEYAHSARGTGLSRFDATVATAFHDSATVTAPPRDSATAAAASQAAVNRLHLSTTVLWTSVDGYSGKFLYLMLLSKSQESSTIE